MSAPTETPLSAAGPSGIALRAPASATPRPPLPDQSHHADRAQGAPQHEAESRKLRAHEEPEHEPGQKPHNDAGRSRKLHRHVTLGANQVIHASSPMFPPATVGRLQCNSALRAEVGVHDLPSLCSYPRFQRTPPGVSLRMMPCPCSSSRMASARAKSLLFRAASRSSTSF